MAKELVEHTETGDITLQEIIDELDSTEMPKPGIEREARDAAIKHVAGCMVTKGVLTDREREFDYLSGRIQGYYTAYLDANKVRV